MARPWSVRLHPWCIRERLRKIMLKYLLRFAVGMPGHKAKGLGTATQRAINIGASATTSGADGTLIVKTSKELSRMNNRLYRQCRNYTVSFDLLTSELDDQTVYKYSFFTLPDTWFVRNAIKYAYQTYMRAHDDEIRAGVKFAKWHDFTIDEQNPDGTWEHAQSLMFDGGAWAGLGADESPVDSSITLNDGSTSMQFRLMGTASGAFNIFEEYANLLNYRTPDDESVTSDQPYEGLLDLKDADKMAEVGDKAPYDRDFTHFLDDGTDDQNILVCQDTLTHDAANAGGRRSTRQFVAPLGLVFVLKYTGDALNAVSASSPELILRAKPGKYKGVHAPSLV